MGEIISCETRTARKPHRCAYCGAAIRIGQSHQRWAWSDNGGVFEGRGHTECGEMHSSLSNPWEADEMMDPGDFREACEEELEGPFPWKPCAPDVAPA